MYCWLGHPHTWAQHDRYLAPVIVLSLRQIDDGVTVLKTKDSAKTTVEWAPGRMMFTSSLDPAGGDEDR